MKNIVYFLGAGFSVPAGLPVISNFLFKAKNQYFDDPVRYNYFKGVFSYIDGLSRAKSYTNVDLFNIEEIFSIADTHELLGKGLKKDLEQFIKDVIIFHTPSFASMNRNFKTHDARISSLFGSGKVSKKYVGFIVAILNIYFKKQKNVDWEVADIKAVAKDSGCSYKFVSLNYDNLIENCVSFINQNYSGTFTIQLTKLHGGVESTIIPPTWNKRINNGLDNAWKDAAQWLSEANEIRILGYSLPKTDMYIKHLFSTALLESKNLQKIDIICLDPDGAVENRYREMFSFPNFRFNNFDINRYLDSFNTHGYSHGDEEINFGFKHDDMHEDVFK